MNTAILRRGAAAQPPPDRIRGCRPASRQSPSANSPALAIANTFTACQATSLFVPSSPSDVAEADAARRQKAIAPPRSGRR
jgi:hypothetical protein